MRKPRRIVLVIGLTLWTAVQEFRRIPLSSSDRKRPLWLRAGESVRLSGSAFPDRVRVSGGPTCFAQKPYCSAWGAVLRRPLNRAFDTGACHAETQASSQESAGYPYLHRPLRNLYVGRKLRCRDVEELFTDVFRGNKFGGRHSCSEPGSDLDQTRVIVRELSGLFRDLRIASILDIPCGDFHWMKTIRLNGMDHAGADIVNDLVAINQRKCGRRNVDFRHLNILGDEWPRVDLILCRDCLVHFSFRDIFRALENLCHSTSEYLLTTTFPGREKNGDIFTGEWRPLNLEIAPFNLPKPLRMVRERCTEGEGAFRDKSLGLWRTAELKKCAAGRTC